MRRVKSARRPLQAVSSEAEFARESPVTLNGLPVFWFVSNASTYFSQRVPVRTPGTDADKDLRRLNMQIETRRVNILRQHMAELNPDVGFIGCFIPAKAGVPVDPISDPPLRRGIASKRLDKAARGSAMAAIKSSEGLLTNS